MHNLDITKVSLGRNIYGRSLQSKHKSCCYRKLVNEYPVQSNILSNERIFVQSFRTNIRYICFSPSLNTVDSA